MIGPKSGWNDSLDENPAHQLNSQSKQVADRGKMIRTGSSASPQRFHRATYPYLPGMSAMTLIMASRTRTHSINQVICLTVHVPLPSVHKQKQIPLNAKTAGEQLFDRQVERHSLTSAMKFT